MKTSPKFQYKETVVLKGKNQEGEKRQSFEQHQIAPKNVIYIY